MENLTSKQQELQLAMYKNNSALVDLCMIQDYKAQAFLEKDPFHQSYANFYLAQTFSLMGELSISTDLLHRTIPFLKETKAYDFLHEAQLILSFNDRILGNQERALAHFNKAIDLNLCTPEAKARICHQFANYFIQFSQYEAALKAAKTGVNHLSLKSKFQRKLYFKLLLQIAQCLSLQGNFTASLEILQKVSKAQKIEKITGIKALCYQQFALLSEQQSNLGKAKYYYKKAIHECLHNEQLLIGLALKVSLSDVLMQQNKYKEAELLLLEAYDSYPYEVNEYFLKLISNLAGIYQVVGNKAQQLRFEQELCLHAS